MLIEYDKLKERILIHRTNIANGSLTFNDDAIALGYLRALDDVLQAMDELRMQWSTGE